MVVSMMALSSHFTLAEFIRSDTANRRGIDNTPTPEIIQNLILVADELERVRTLLGVPIIVTSGYRCLKLNTVISSKPTSAHVQGLAVDFQAPGFGSSLEICKKIMDSDIVFDQLINEFGAWVHLGLSDKPRHQVLTMDKNGTRNGL